MLGWTLTYAMSALIAAAVGFGGTTGATATIAQSFFALFTALFVISVIVRTMRGKDPFDT
ncbi:DUF1328 domain-containing protein [Falsirhodobacter sp. alg1]|uniref:DUF1328 domain-containing protein n=1 Tax=Falsirhodobacter sp. alg1 TaxID=1472418 RepID=UPI0005EFBC8D|nr:DUF1328 domain-containing protein [Falsirhodobacter sp. alg1]